MPRYLVTILTLVALIGLALPAAAQSNDWQWNLTPYFWGANTGVDVKLDDQELVDVSIPLDDIIDRLDFAFMVDFQGQRGRNGFLIDLATYDFNDDPVRFPLPGGISELVASGDLEMTQLDFGGIYNPSGNGMGFTLIYGVRMLDVDQEIDAYVDAGGTQRDSQRYAAAETFWDGLLGARYLLPFADSWLLQLKADVSTGSTEYTWSALAGVGYTFGSRDQYTVLGGYRYMEYDFEQDVAAHVRIASSMTLDGFYGAFRFGF